MVNVGGPSKGCITCIKRKIRCDKERPGCQQCRKSRRQCGGYRDSNDLIFRDQSADVVAKARACSTEPKRRSKRSQSSACADANIFTTQSCLKESIDEPDTPSIPDSPTLEEASTVINFFANNFTCGNSVEKRNNLFWIPEDFASFLNNDSIKFSAQCVGAIAVARLHGSAGYALKAQTQYGLALKSVSARWQRGTEIVTASTFLAVLLLSFFEVLDTSSRGAWRAHLGGLESLFRQCTGPFLHTPFGARIFRQARSQIILHALQTHTHVAELLAKLSRPGILWEPPVVKPFDDADRLLIALASIQADCAIGVSSAVMLPKLLLLDKDLTQWVESAHSLWSFQVQPTVRQSGLWWDSRCDVYDSGFIAHAWNKIRTAQIITHDLIIGLLSQLPSNEAAAVGYLSSFTVNNSPSLKVRQLVTEICSTIPTYYRPAHKVAGQAAEGGPPLLGRTFWFIWPLEVIGSMNESSPELIDWISQCFECIYERTGILVAKSTALRLRSGYRGPVLP